jgi:hypothetical protein
VTWFYSQRTGILRHNEEVVACGYSGKGECKNDPLAEAKHNLGPIPRGNYQMGPPRDTDSHGPFVIPLRASMENRMYGRGGFLIHGDSRNLPGQASEGCIIADRPTRERMWASGDRDLDVIEG